MNLRRWMFSGTEEQVKEPVEVGGLELDPDGEVLESGFELEEFQEDIEEREEFIDQLQRDIDRHGKKKQRAVERARDAKNRSEKEDYMVEAKEHKVLKQKKKKVLDHLRKEKLMLKKLKLQHMQDNIGSGLDSDLDIDVSQLPTSDIESAIEESGDDLLDSRDTIQDIEDSLELADSEAAGLDLSDIEEEVDDVDSDEEIQLENRSLETEEEIDQAIDEELQKLEDV